MEWIVFWVLMMGSMTPLTLLGEILGDLSTCGCDLLRFRRICDPGFRIAEGLWGCVRN